MASVQCYLNELDKWRDRLADILTSKGIESSQSEKLNTLVPKVEELSTGGIPVGNATLILDNVLIGVLTNATEA